MTGEDSSIEIEGTNYTKAQIDRQTQRIYDVVFVNGTYAEDDGSYGGKLHPELVEIIRDGIVINEVIEEARMNEIFTDIITKVREWIGSNVKSVHPIVLDVFVADFVPNCVQQFFTIEEADGGPSEYDPAYG